MFSRVARWSTVSHIIYVLLVLLTAVFVAVSSAFLLSQAVRTEPNRSFVRNPNVVVIGGAYVVVVRPRPLLRAFWRGIGG